MTHKLLLDIPDRIETVHLLLRCYQPGDGSWYYQMSMKNKEHLARYESENAVMTINTEQDAEITMREFALAWAGRKYFMLGAFLKTTGMFVAQVYIGPMNWKLPEFQVGYIADVGHEGKGYVTEAVNAATGFIFEHLQAHRIGLECDETNIRSWKVAERCGYTREGRLRENKLNADGTISDTYIYGLLRSEFKTGQ
jgi:RimJ/RimL family protein N-acetyltransferase